MAQAGRKRTASRGGSKKVGGLNIETSGFNWKSGKAIAYYIIIAIAAGALIYMNVVPAGA
jgi:hypothetical protein